VLPCGPVAPSNPVDPVTPLIGTITMNDPDGTGLDIVKTYGVPEVTE
jgi:hypothetical protein